MKRQTRVCMIITCVIIILTSLTLFASCSFIDKVKEKIDGYLSTKCEHDWQDATCTTPKTCSKCSATMGKAWGHDFIAGKCYRCGVLEGSADIGGDSSSALPDSSSYDPACEHDWQDATCTVPQTCSKCGKTIGSSNGHIMGGWIIDKTATCTEEGARHKECTVCGATLKNEILVAKGHYGELLLGKNYDSHYMVYSCCYKQATTAEKHTKVNGVCTVCGFNPTVTVESVNVTQKEKQVKLVLSISDNPGIIGLVATVRYNSDVFKLTEAKSGEALSSLTFTTPSVLKSGCSFLWDGVEMQDKDIKDGEFLILTFTISENAPDGEYIVSLDFSAYDNNLNQITLNITGGKITIKNK